MKSPSGTSSESSTVAAIANPVTRTNDGRSVYLLSPIKKERELPNSLAQNNERMMKMDVGFLMAFRMM